MSEAEVSEPFGRQVTDLTSAELLLALEDREQKTELFSAIDPLAAVAIGRALKREIALLVERRRTYRNAQPRSSSSNKVNVVIAGLDSHQEQILADIYSVEQQQLRGAWFLPQKATLKVGLVNLSAIFLQYPRYAHGISDEQSTKVVFAENPAAVFAWTVLEPLCARLFLPLEIRADRSGLKGRDEHLSAWEEIDRLVAALGFRLNDELAVMRYGGGWKHLSSEEKIAAKQTLLASIANQATESTAKRFRAFCCLDLIINYYTHARNGRATRKQALTRISDKKALVGFFQGDWLRFLEYLGEQPHPDEQLTTALPRSKFFVGGEKTPADVALEKGVPLEEVERVVSTFWDVPRRTVPQLSSPVEERVGVLSDFWFAFDEIHARQASGAKSLWGLIEESRSIRIGWQGLYHSGLYQELLPQPVLRRIEESWAGIMFPRWPNRIVSEISPHALMAETFGPALAFWHGCALSAWFVCEGPSSRTDIRGMREYFQRDLVALEQLGAPIDVSLFAEMNKAETLLGPVVPLESPREQYLLQPGIQVSVRSVIGSRRSGFESLRDIITQYRREWANGHLSSYLRARWEGDLREITRIHAEKRADKGKSLPPPQFARLAAVATNRWFGGNISTLCAAIGEKSFFRPMRVSLMPADRRGFAAKILTSLQTLFGSTGGTPLTHLQNLDLEQLAGESLRVVQLREALGRSPTFKEFKRFVRLKPGWDLNFEQMWHRYVSLIEAELCLTIPS
ncbi:MAG: hypothetical protein FWC84_03475 [Alphaproteobacteria bacterium]|nr:hypothetical protein [Alphaproteobacteria bacterium]